PIRELNFAGERRRADINDQGLAAFELSRPAVEGRTALSLEPAFINVPGVAQNTHDANVVVGTDDHGRLRGLHVVNASALVLRVGPWFRVRDNHPPDLAATRLDVPYVAAAS